MSDVIYTWAIIIAMCLIGWWVITAPTDDDDDLA